jgi:magnesium chelatase subunit H
MPKPISRAEASTPRIVIVTMDEEMLDRMAHLDRTAAAKNANRLIQAQGRRCGSQSTDALRRAGDELEDRIEFISEGAAA